MSRIILLFCTLFFGVTSLLSQELALAKKPPMGWNSFDSYGVYLSEKEAFKNVEAMADLLKPFGYEYFVIDNGWFGEYKLRPGTNFPAEKHASDVNINEYGILQPSKTYFPGGIKAVADYAHKKGLKFGIHLMRGIPRKAVERNTPIKGTPYFASEIADKKNSCSWCLYNYGVDMDKPGAQEFYDSLIEQLAEWGVDFIKADDIVPYPREVKALAEAIKKTGRPMVLSLSPGDHVREVDLPTLKQGNMLRVTADIWDDEGGIRQCFAAWKKWQGKSEPGFWIDMDMIPFGRLQVMSPKPAKANVEGEKHVALAGKGYERDSELSKDQMQTFIVIRAMTASPLMMGGRLVELDDLSLQLLTNKEMLACNQNGVMGEIVAERDGLIAARTEHKGGGGWAAVFNRKTTPMTVKWSRELCGLPEGMRCHDVWGDQEIKNGQQYEIPAQGVLFIRYTPTK